MTKLLPIDQVSERSGVAISALRFYEQLGLLASERDARGRRMYAPEVLRRIAFISVGTSVGLTLAEIVTSWIVCQATESRTSETGRKLHAAGVPTSTRASAR